MTNINYDNGKLNLLQILYVYCSNVWCHKTGTPGPESNSHASVEHLHLQQVRLEKERKELRTRQITGGHSQSKCCV